ncbi:hypothetical protein GX50_07509 [[Emmonsia] crescens]|uniref:Asteroid domain-containing protein n=1 Tax=[Emmonsia] crescens TaxID=73230 RepID=A0A2B7Z718_9EURO|nr:hypothetical protein GX50_07509 [Emmonsia crescens]
MGIRYLTHHLLPHAQTVWLRNTKNNDQSGKNISCVVVDGPGLVYLVYNRLLSWSEGRSNVVDAQPSANEVSIGVMQFLLSLRGLDVRMHIYFDGALPLSKRPIRLERLEGTRQKLQQLCRDTAGGFKASSIRRKPIDIHPDKIFGQRPLYPRFKVLPETTFMIPTVIEDLKYRWSPEEVLRCTAGVPELQGAITTCGNNDNNYDDNWSSIFAEIVEVVPGEADVYCAIAARDSGCAVLTSDSDLLVHDLGAEGSVILFDSIETGDRLPNEIPKGEEPDTKSISIRATQLRPASIAKKLGVVSFQRLAYELRRDSRASFSIIIQRAKSDTGVVEKSAKYISFMKEYDLDSNATTAACARISNPSVVVTDPKLAELYAQYELPAFTAPGEGACVYLPILIERHDRRAVWMQGDELRLIAYSLLNLGYPAGEKGRRKEVVIEHMRKGQRIAPIALTLLAQREVEQRLEAFLAQINALVTSPHNDDVVGDEGARDPAAFWRSFALYDVLVRMEREERPSVGKLRRFLEQGYCGEKLEWDDIHLHAQMQAVLYSLRMLKEVLLANEESMETLFGEKLRELICKAAGVLRDLPWMRDTAQRRGGICGDENVEDVRRVVEGLFSLLNEEGEAEELGMDSIQGPDRLGVSSHSPNDPGNVNSSTGEAGDVWVITSTLPKSKKRKKRRTSSAGTEETAPTTTRRRGSGSKPKQTMNMYDILRQVD